MNSDSLMGKIVGAIASIIIGFLLAYATIASERGEIKTVSNTNKDNIITLQNDVKELRDKVEEFVTNQKVIITKLDALIEENKNAE